MTYRLVTLTFVAILALARSAFCDEAAPLTKPLEADPKAPAAKAAPASFYVIPIDGPIGEPTLYAVRSGVKAAIDGEYETIVLEMKTPGGRLDSTLDILETLDRFPGKTVTFVREATSAGAIITSITNEIYFEPRGTMGSAEVVSGTGEDIDESMKRKIMSFLDAKMEAYTAEYPFRSDVIRAMMDPDFEFKIGDEVISPAGKLLNLNAERAMKEYGDPPRPILASGITTDVDQLLETLALGREKLVTRFTPTWSLKLAQVIVTIAPVLLAIAMITVYMEMQTPGFGVFGIVGVVCFVIAIFGHNVAGLSGHEPMLLFLLGVLLMALELFVAPGTLFFAIPGMVLMLVSIIWSMTDVWPSNTPDFTWNWEMFERPLQNLMAGILLGVVMILVIARFMPRSFVWNRLVLSATIAGNAKESSTGASASGAAPEASLIGSVGSAMTPLNPTGEVEVGGRRIEAKVTFGSVPRGGRVRVVGRTDFGYVVEEVES